MFQQYTFSETVANVYNLLCTKLFYRPARLIRRPFYCRGKAALQFDAGFTTGYHCRFDLVAAAGDKAKKLVIGKNCKIGDNVHIVAHEKVTIGDNCLMASKIFISDTTHGIYTGKDLQSAPTVAPADRPLHTKPVTIGDNVWIGENVCILLGVTVGNGCIIGANSVVTRDLPANSIGAGSPAKVIKVYEQERQMWIKALNKSS